MYKANDLENLMEKRQREAYFSDLGEEYAQEELIFR